MSQGTAFVAISQKMPGQALPLGCAYLIEALTSISFNLLMNGVAFYTTQKYGWTTRQNLLLMMTQGVVYALGALSAGSLARRFSKPRLLLIVNALLMALVLALQLYDSAAWVISIMLVFVYVGTLTWPLVESLVVEGCDARHMNRRITVYNMTWSIVGVAVIAVYGTILQYWPGGPMIIPLICQGLGLAAAIILFVRHREPAAPPCEPSHADPVVAQQLAGHRRMALWLSRLSLPASFVVANTLMGIFPTLHISQEIGVVFATLLASMWMASRFVVFMVLGATDWWHARPKLLLIGGLLLFLAFLMIVLPAERFGPFASMPATAIVFVIAAAELLLGIVAGFIFSASLYFGMVLSEGSTDHGGYHEALIGAGMVLGPGLAAGAQAMVSPDSRSPAILAVSALMTLTLGAAVTVATRLRQS